MGLEVCQRILSGFEYLGLRTPSRNHGIFIRVLPFPYITVPAQRIGRAARWSFFHARRSDRVLGHLLEYVLAYAVQFFVRACVACTKQSGELLAGEDFGVRQPFYLKHRLALRLRLFGVRRFRTTDEPAGNGHHADRQCAKAFFSYRHHFFPPPEPAPSRRRMPRVECSPATLRALLAVWAGMADMDVTTALMASADIPSHMSGRRGVILT